jgi:uncharacterized protein YjiK
MIQYTFILLVFSTFACAQDQRDGSILNHYFSDIQRTEYRLNKELKEISGLAVTNDGRLLAHNDEEGKIFQIDYQSGKVIKTFKIGKKKIKEDFEGLAATADGLFLVTSSGDLYLFSEGDDEDEMPYQVFQTHLSSKNDVEGLCFDPASNALLLACKGYPGKGFNKKKTVYSFSLSTMQLSTEPHFVLPAHDLFESDQYSLLRKIGSFFLLPTEKKFSPSGIIRHAKSGHFFILSANDPMIIEVSAQGDVVGTIELDAQEHSQPEGIAFLPDYTLIVVDEGAGKRARLTLYRPSE